MSSILKNSVLTTAYLPPVKYFGIIKNDPEWKLERFGSYCKQSYRNRCHIYGANGLLPLYIPVCRAKGYSREIGEVKIDNSDNWQIKHWRAIVSAYNSSPFFDYFKDDLHGFYHQKYESLFEFNTSLLKVLLELLGLPAEIRFTDSFKSYEYGDFRELVHPKKESPLIYPNNQKGRYHQVFALKSGFIPNLSVIDLLFNEGPESLDYL
ncbi:MAG: hypothetical protein EOM61_03165 [Bacteroidia bacterium]|nr:hypothetical protein [Bacteroidia bacterium]